MTKAKETKKQGFKPWNKEAKENLEHAKLQAEKELLIKMQAVDLLEAGQSDIDEEIEGYISESRLELKKATLNLRKMEFDKTHDITKKETMFALSEAKKEVKRLTQNFNALDNQLKEGQPILEEQTGSEVAKKVHQAAIEEEKKKTEQDAVNKEMTKVEVMEAQEDCADIEDPEEE